MKPILEASGETKDTVKKQAAASVADGFPKHPYLAFYAGVERFGHKWFLMWKQKH